MQKLKPQNNYTLLKVNKNLVDLIRIYCIFHNKKITNFVQETIEKELAEFKKQLESLRKRIN